MNLRLRPCDRINEIIHRVIAPSCPNLRGVDLGVTGLTNSGIKSLVSGSSGLSTVRLDFCTLVSDAGVSALRHCSGIRVISLRGTQVTDIGLFELTAGCHELRDVTLRGTMVTDVGIEALAVHGKLHALDIAFTRVSDRGLSGVATHCPDLKAIFLEFCMRITDRGVQVLAKYCPSLVEVDLGGTCVSDAGAKSLAVSCAHLSTLDLSMCSEVTDRAKIELRRQGITLIHL